MRKKLGYLFVTISVVLMALYFFRYKRTLEIEGKIPKLATKVVHIDLRQIEHHFLVDVLTNPLSYIDIKPSRKKKDSLSLLKAISVPKNIFFYTNGIEFNGFWLSTIVKIKDRQQLYEYLNREQFKKSSEKNITIFKKNRIELAIKNEQLIIALNNSKKESTLVFQTIFKNTEFISKASKLLIPIVNNESDICYSSNTDDFLEANFKKGVFNLTGTVKSDFFIEEMHPDFTYNSIASITTKVNGDNKLFNSQFTDVQMPKFKEFTKLSLDSILEKWNGELYINLKSFHNTIDTIVTYEYDDDFNKIETISTQNLLVPNVEIVLESGENSALYNYLLQKKAIQIIENDTLFTGMPLYKLYVHTAKNSMQISSEKKFKQPSYKKKNNKINGYINVERSLDYKLDVLNLPLHTKYLKLLKDVSINLSESDELIVKINFKNDARNIIGQFVKP